jgi:fibronectin-binding autotransporter adhesin
MNHANTLSRLTRTRTSLAIAVLMISAATAQADIVTIGPNPQPLPNCPANVLGLPGLCLVETAAQVQGTVADFAKVRIGRGGSGSLLIDSGANLIVNRTELAPGVPANPDVIVGDDIGAAGGLTVRNGGQLSVTVPAASNNFLGLGVGVFAAPAGYSGPSTVVNLTEGGRIRVDKAGGVGIGSAIAVGAAAGSDSLVLLDGGIDGFGNQALRPHLDTTGNLSIGREGTGAVSLFRHADLTANLIYLAAVGLNGNAQLAVGLNSTVQAQRIMAGIAVGPGPLGYDILSANHGLGVISTRDTGVINADIVLGQGGVLMGTGSVGPSVLNYGGVIRPGFSPGKLTIDGSYTDIGGHIEIEIGAGGSDFLAVLGALSLDGTEIVFKFVDGFAPAAGFTYDFLDADGALTLANLHYSFSGLQPGFEFDVNADPLTGLFSFVARNDGVAVPEPGVPALLGLAGLAAWAARRRRSEHPNR